MLTLAPAKHPHNKIKVKVEVNSFFGVFLGARPISYFSPYRSCPLHGVTRDSEWNLNLRNGTHLQEQAMPHVANRDPNKIARNSKIFIAGKTFVFGHCCHRFGRHSVGKNNTSNPFVWSLSLENLHFKGYLAFKMNTNPLPLKESGRPTPKREHAKWRGRAKWLGQGAKVLFCFTKLVMTTNDKQKC